MRVILGWTFLALGAIGATSAGAGEPVDIALPVKARLDLSGYRSLTVIPFIASPTEGSSPIDDAERQLMRYLARTIERGTALDVDTLAVDLPTWDPAALMTHEAFWRHLGERTGSDLILAGAIDLDVQDRSGYVTREFVSDQDGRTHFAQVLVEQTGVELDLLVWVIEARGGRVLLQDNFKDFKAWGGESLDPTAGLFAGLATLEDRLLGIFRQRTVTAERLLQ